MTTELYRFQSLARRNSNPIKWAKKINLQGTPSIIEATLFVKAQGLSLRPGRERKPEGHAHCTRIHISDSIAAF